MAFMLLTRLPVARLARPGAPRNQASCVWAFPIVGIAVGASGGFVYWLSYDLGMGALLASVWTLAAMTIITGALHEDGLADSADGLGGGATIARKMEIMRDSRIGSYGALALILSTFVRASAIARLDRPVLVASALVVAAMLARSGIVLFLLILKPARDDGMGASMASPQTARVASGLGIAVIGALTLLPLHHAIAAVIVGLASCLLMAKFTDAQIGGYTGDVLGAAEMIVDCIVLTIAASSL